MREHAPRRHAFRVADELINTSPDLLEDTALKIRILFYDQLVPVDWMCQRSVSSNQHVAGARVEAMHGFPNHEEVCKIEGRFRICKMQKSPRPNTSALRTTRAYDVSPNPWNVVKAQRALTLLIDSISPRFNGPRNTTGLTPIAIKHCLLFVREKAVMADFGQSDFGQPSLANLFGDRVWPNRRLASVNFLVVWADFGQNRLWPKPTLAKTDFGQSKDFGFWELIVWFFWN